MCSISRWEAKWHNMLRDRFSKNQANQAALDTKGNQIYCYWYMLFKIVPKMHSIFFGLKLNIIARKGEGNFWSFLKLEILLNFKRVYILLIGLIHMFLNWNLSTLSLTIYFNRKHYMKVLALPTDKAQSSHFFLKITFLDGVNVKVTNIFK